MVKRRSDVDSDEVFSDVFLKWFFQSGCFRMFRLVFIDLSSAFSKQVK